MYMFELSQWNVIRLRIQQSLYWQSKQCYMKSCSFLIALYFASSRKDLLLSVARVETSAQFSDVSLPPSWKWSSIKPDVRQLLWGNVTLNILTLYITINIENNWISPRRIRSPHNTRTRWRSEAAQLFSSVVLDLIGEWMLDSQP